jgi:DNA-binding transcriptional LysR family regulator
MMPDRQLAAFAEGKLHVGFTRPLPAKGQQGLQSELVLQESLLAVVSETHLLADKSRARLADLSAHPFVLLDRVEATGLFDHVIAMCQAAGFSPSIVNAPDLMATVLTLVAAEQGISIVPESVRNLRRSAIRFLDLQPKQNPIPLVMIWKDTADSLPMTAFQNLVREHLKEIRQNFVKR